MGTLDFRNTNTLWASVLVETLVRLGLTTAVLCPGSRSTPLTVAFARHPQVEAIPSLDERSAAFFALGIAKRTGQAVVVVCTSGTAGANFYPAVIEAHESRVPLLLLTADRPPELRDCNSGQTIDQQKLFGSFPRWYGELAIPQADRAMLRYLRQVIGQAWVRSHLPIPGPVHLNCPFRDPLSPLSDTAAPALIGQLEAEPFFAHLPPSLSPPLPISPSPYFPISPLITQWQNCDRGLIILGHTQPLPPQDYSTAIAHLARSLGWPVLVDGLSPLRNHANSIPHLISTYDLILRHSPYADQLIPQQVLQIGPLPTSKELRQWLERIDPQRWVLDPAAGNLDPLHGAVQLLPLSLSDLVAQIPLLPAPQRPYSDRWMAHDCEIRNRIHATFTAMEDLIESKVAWLLPQILPPQTPVMIANSMPIRDVEWFWLPNDRRLHPYVNRGANGIDGTLSTALGLAHRHRPTVLLTGDLALLHDTNGFLSVGKLQGHLTIVVINNRGGGIFGMLPIAAFDPPFEDFFATPQQVDLAQLCAAYSVEHQPISNWQAFTDCLKVLPESGVRVLEVKCDRTQDAQWRKVHLSQLGAGGSGE